MFLKRWSRAERCRGTRRLLPALLLLGLVFSSGCAIRQPSAATEPLPTPSSVPTIVIPTAISDEAPVVVPPAANAPRDTSQSPEPTPEQTGGWEAYSNQAYNISLRYPPSWKRDPGYDLPDSYRYSGPDGFFMLSASNANTIDEAAQFEANHKLRPYGSNPDVRKMQILGQDARLIMPSDDQAPEMHNQAGLIVVSPKPIQIGGSSYKYLVLWADKDHIQTIASTLRFGVPERGGSFTVTGTPQISSAHTGGG